MFYVYSKEPETDYEKITSRKIKKKVYAIQYKNGYPFFTFYENGKWVTRSAKYYEPVEN